ncbi:MAG: hypothetical protein AB7S93_05415 [Xanthobacteraceae bacterium]
MSDPQPSSLRAALDYFKPRNFLRHEWPYLLVLALALFGIAYTSFARTPMTLYWIVLAPLIGIICVVSRWPELPSRDERIRLIWTQVAHWAAVLVAIRLVFIADVERMMNSDASALAALTLLALGTFTAGIHISSWRICLVGVLLALGVPGVAWFEQSALLLMLIVLVVVAIAAPIYWHNKRGREPLHMPPP